MPKRQNVRAFNVTANAEIIRKFRAHCIENDIPIYEGFETAIRKYLEAAGKKIELPKPTAPKPTAKLATNPLNPIDAAVEELLQVKQCLI